MSISSEDVKKEFRISPMKRIEMEEMTEKIAVAMTFLICMPYFVLSSLASSKLFVLPGVGLIFVFLLFAYIGFKAYPWVYRAVHGEMERRERKKISVQ